LNTLLLRVAALVELVVAVQMVAVVAAAQEVSEPARALA
jgi:hypothetical protein